MKKLVVCLSLLLIVTAGTALAEEPVTLKLSTLMPAQSVPVKKALQPWAEMLEKASEGTLKVEIFPGGVLGSNMKMYFQQMETGVFDMTLIYPAYFGERFPEADLFYLPFIAGTYMEGAVAAQTLFEKGLFTGYDDCKVLMFVATSPFYLATTFEANTPEDLKGHTLRSSSRVQAEVITQLGMTPVGMATNEQAEAMARGLIEGTLSDPITMVAFRLADKARNLIKVPMGNFLLVIAMNKDKYNSLPPKAKAAIDKHSGLWLAKYWAEQNAPLNENILAGWEKESDRNIVKPDAEQMKEWKKAMQPVTDKWIQAAPGREELWKSFQAEVEKVRAAQ